MLQRFFRSVWKDFETIFKSTLASIRRHRDLLESNATASAYNEAREFRQKCREDLDTLITKTSEDRYTRLLQWLSTDESEEQHSEVCSVRRNGAAYALRSGESVKTRSDSGQWIVKHPKLIAWIREDFAKTTTLWLNGIPGAGKTVLTSAIVEYCKEQKLVTASKTIYFYCKNGEPHQSTCSGILRGFLRQLLAQDHPLLGWCHDKYQTSGELVLRSDQLAIELLRALLPDDQRTFMLLDGLDECGKDERMRLLKHLQSLSDIQDDGRLRVLVASQVEPDIRRGLKSFDEITIRAANINRDIETYVSDGCDIIGSRFDLTKEECTGVMHTVMTHVGGESPATSYEDHLANIIGMFLYAKLVIRNLYHQPDKRGFWEEMQPDTFPEGLDEA
jgi:hypothetical protein